MLSSGSGEDGKGSALTELRLHHNRLTAEGGGSLALILGSLASLDVSGNPLGSSGAAALLPSSRASIWFGTAAGILASPRGYG